MIRIKSCGCTLLIFREQREYYCDDEEDRDTQYSLTHNTGPVSEVKFRLNY